MGRIRGLGGLDLPLPLPEGVKLVKAKLSLPTPSPPLLELEPMEALLPCRLCLLPSSGSA